jgi:hypothetical protein
MKRDKNNSIKIMTSNNAVKMIWKQYMYEWSSSISSVAEHREINNLIGNRLYKMVDATQQ